MTLAQRINDFEALGSLLSRFLKNTPKNDEEQIVFEQLKQVLLLAEQNNPWFTTQSWQTALAAISQTLSKNQLDQWLKPYELQISKILPKKVAIIMAGNIPLVGFHDFLSVLLTGHVAVVKLSHLDQLVLPFLSQWLIKHNKVWEEKIIFQQEKLNHFDAVIATGSNNSARYFEYYFAKYPHIIRKNRNSVAILTGRETDDDLKGLLSDIFTYYGLGCRNVSKLYVPEGYSFDRLLSLASTHFADIAMHKKYFNNYEYQKAILLVNKIPHFDNGFFIIKSDNALASPISVLHSETYDSIPVLEEKLKSALNDIQCIVGNKATSALCSTAFGTTQTPSLTDYADGVNTIDFLTKI